MPKGLWSTITVPEYVNGGAVKSVELGGKIIASRKVGDAFIESGRVDLLFGLAVLERIRSERKELIYCRN